MHPSLLAAVCVLLAASSAQGQAPQLGAPDLILTGGKVFTADPARPWAEAVAIGGERIVAVGKPDN
jgi:hypothetical protein